MDTLKKVYDTMIKRYFQESRTRMLAWLGMFVLIFLIILSAHFVPERTIWEVGSVSDQDIQSDRYLTFVDEEGTLRKQQQALEDFQDVYRIDLNKFNPICYDTGTHGYYNLGYRVGNAYLEGKKIK